MVAWLQPAADIEAFVRDPIGKYRVGRSYVIWCHSATLAGSIDWDRPTDADVRELTQLFDMARHPALAGGFDVWMDNRAIDGVEWRAFMRLQEYVRSRLPEWGRVIRRHAVLQPGGPVGMLLTGLVPMLGMTYPMRFFTDRGPAFEWIGREDLRPVVAEVEAIADAARGLGPTVRALRAYLAVSLRDASVEGAARALAVAPRSLQRELRSAHTRFSTELHAARVEAACARLAHTDEKIEAIAREVGCASTSQLSTLFKRSLGETPGQYRARRLAELGTSASAFP